MIKQVDVRIVESILHGVFKALYSTLGEGYLALMRKASLEMLTMLDKFGVKFSDINEMDQLSSKFDEMMTNIGICEKVSFELDEDLLTVEVSNCSFSHLCSELKEAGIPLFGCPVAMLTLAVAERNLNKKARIKEIDPFKNKDNSRILIQLF